MASILLYHAFKAMTPFVDAFVNERLYNICCQALTIACLCRRLECVVQQNGGYIEHLFK